MSKVIVTDHPLIQHKLTLMRDKNTGSKDFRELLTEISMLMGYEITRNVQLEEIHLKSNEICKGKGCSRDLWPFKFQPWSRSDGDNGISPGTLPNQGELCRGRDRKERA